MHTLILDFYLEKTLLLLDLQGMYTFCSELYKFKNQRLRIRNFLSPLSSNTSIDIFSVVTCLSTRKLPNTMIVTNLPLPPTNAVEIIVK